MVKRRGAAREGAVDGHRHRDSGKIEARQVCRKRIRPAPPAPRLESVVTTALMERARTASGRSMR